MILRMGIYGRKRLMTNGSTGRKGRHGPNYPSNPDLNYILSIFFMFTSLKVEGGSPGSNVVWIDEITLE